MLNLAILFGKKEYRWQRNTLVGGHMSLRFLFMALKGIASKCCWKWLANLEPGFHLILDMS